MSEITACLSVQTGLVCVSTYGCTCGVWNARSCSTPRTNHRALRPRMRLVPFKNVRTEVTRLLYNACPYLWTRASISNRHPPTPALLGASSCSLAVLLTRQPLPLAACPGCWSECSTGRHFPPGTALGRASASGMGMGAVLLGEPDPGQGRGSTSRPVSRLTTPSV